MNILLIDVLPSVALAFGKAGHKVRELRPGGGIFYLPGLLKTSGFSPDLVIQQEHLGTRSYFGGWEHLSCPTVFWAIDSHLNLFWQQ